MNEEAIRIILSNIPQEIYQSKNVEDEVDVIYNVPPLSSYQKMVLSERCGISNPTKEEIKEMRLIPNLKSFIEDNFPSDHNIHSQFKKLKLKEGMDVTFATDDFNTFMIRTNQLKIKLTANDLRTSSYSIGEEKPKSLVVAEGIFDVVNLAKTFKEKDPAIYISTLGFSNMRSVITDFYIRNVFSVENLIVYLDSDNKLPNGKFEPKVELVKSIIKTIDHIGRRNFKMVKLVYNKKSKDFGDLSLPVEKEEYVLEYK